MADSDSDSDDNSTNSATANEDEFSIDDGSGLGVANTDTTTLKTLAAAYFGDDDDEDDRTNPPPLGSVDDQDLEDFGDGLVDIDEQTRHPRKRSSSRASTEQGRRHTGVNPGGFYSNQVAPKTPKKGSKHPASASRSSSNKKKKARTVTPLDDNRPDNEKSIFDSFSKAKQHHRRTSGSPSLRNSPQMPATTRNSAGSGHTEVSDNSSPAHSADEHSPRAAKKSAQAAELTRQLDEQNAKDKKLNNGDRLKALTKCRAIILKLGVQNGRIPQFKKQIADLEKDKTGLEAQVKKLEEAASARNSRAKSQLLRVNEATRNLVEEKVKTHLWKSTKFITCPDDLDDATEKVMIFCQLGEKSVEEKNSWILTYKPFVKKKLNKERNYLTAELKKVAWAIMQAGNDLPTVGTMVMCATRQVVVENEDKFKWYWEKILPKLLGKAEWGETVRYYTTILEAKTQTNPPRALCPVSHEAMVCVIWENNYEKWKDLYAWTKMPENKGKNQPNRAGKYTVTDQGQAEWGGWQPEGLEAYNKYKKMIRAARKDEEKCSTLEHKILAQLRKERGIDCESSDQQAKKNRAKKRKLQANLPLGEAKVYKKVSTVDPEDEEDA